MRGSHIERNGRAAVIAALLLSGCGAAGEQEGGDPPVAEAYQEKLYRSDLVRMIPPDAPKEDSVALAQQFIDAWARERVLLHKAEENLSTAQKDVQQQLRDYRESLIVYAYEQALVSQKLDTNISTGEIEAYYAENEKNFELKDNIVRARWFKLRETDKRVLRKVEDLWRSDKPEEFHDLEVLLAQRGSVINDTHDDWMAFSELQQQVPLRPDNPTDWIPRQHKVVVADSVGVFFVDILEHRLMNSVSPMELVHTEIRSILINQRKLQLIERMRKDLYDEALARQDVKLR
jgi:hypothetical protein